MGGPSILENQYDLSQIDKDKFVVFLESKSLTPRFMEYGLIPDYYLVNFPEKCQSNAFQMVVDQSFKAGIDLTKLLKPEFLEEYLYLKENFEQFFEVWRPHKGPHKKFRIKPNLFLKNSPFDVLPQLPNVPIITHQRNKELFSSSISETNPSYFYDDQLAEGEFSLTKYYLPEETEDRIILNGYGHLNAAAIAIFPLISYLGFSKLYLLGMDMSMLGSMEYSSLYTFKSLKHYNKFFKKAIPVFSHNFKKNRQKFMRPPYEFEDMKSIMATNHLEFISVYEPFDFAVSFDWIRKINFQELLNE